MSVGDSIFDSQGARGTASYIWAMRNLCSLSTSAHVRPLKKVSVYTLFKPNLKKFCFMKQNMDGYTDTSQDERAPKKAKAVLSPGIVMATDFWNSGCIHYLDTAWMSHMSPNYWHSRCRQMLPSANGRRFFATITYGLTSSSSQRPK